MISTADLGRAARVAFELASATAGIREVEVFAAANASLLARVSYASHVPSNGVEEPKSSEAHGLGLRVVLDDRDGVRVGFGSVTGDLTPAAARRALDRALGAAVADREFTSLPRDTGARRTLRDYHDPTLADLPDEAVVGAGWDVVRGGLGAFRASSRLAARAGSEDAVRELGLVLGGDVGVLLERIAVVSTHLPDVQTDESTVTTAFVTAMVEAERAKGSGWATGNRLEALGEGAGAEAAHAAIDGIGGVRVPSGEYTVVFGPQPITDLLDNLVVPACTASAFSASRTPFLGKLGRRIVSPRLSIRDDGAARGLAASKGITCEGLATGRTELVREGVLVGCLSNWYETERLLRDPELAHKLGTAGADAARALAPRNGFRFGGGGGRHFDRPPGIGATNVVVEGTGAVVLPELICTVRDGLYVGRIWYTYPINGLQAADFTCTVVGDSWLIRDGRLSAPLQPNSLRIDDNVVRLLDAVVGASTRVRGTVVWAADQVVYTPDIAVARVPVHEIDRG